jgi:hypothetical protein
MVDVAIPLRLVTTATLAGVLARIIIVDDIGKPGTVAEMMIPTVEQSFWANTRAPESPVSELAGAVRLFCQTNWLGPKHHIVLRYKISGC